MDDLVERLSEEGQKVVVGGPNPSVKEFKRRITELGHVFVKFPDSRGGTDLGIRVDTGATKTGVKVNVEGTLNLNYVEVRCVADIDLATLSGTGHLVTLTETPVG